MQDTKKTKEKFTSIKNYFYKPEPSDGAKLLVVIFAFGLFAGSAPRAFAQSCGSGILVTGNQTNCVNTGSTQSCDTVFAIEAATIPSVGLSLCFTIVDSKGKPLAHGFVEYTQLYRSIQLDHLYDTAAWGGYYQNKYGCDPSIDTPCPGNCPALFTNDPTAGGTISDSNIISYPGVAGCRRSGGGWTQGCGSPGCTGCVYTAWALVPNSTTSPTQASVYSLGQRFNTPTLTLTIVDASGTSSVNTTTNTNSAVLGNFTLQIVGSLSDTPTEFGTNKVVYLLDTQDAILAPTSDLNVPVAGSIGDIQGSSISTIMAGGKTAFIYANDIATLVPNPESTTVNFLTSGLSTASIYPVFPQTVGGQIYAYNNFLNQLYSIATQSSAIVFTLTSSTPITITRTINLVCPKFTLQNITGCYQCSSGWSMSVLISSTCADGPVSVSLDSSGSDSQYQSINTPYLDITTTPTVYVIYGKTSVMNQNVCVNITGNTASQSACIPFTATYVNNTAPLDQNQGNTSDPNSVYHSNNSFVNAFLQVGAWFERVFSGLGAWWEDLLMGLICLAILVVFIFLLPYIVKLFKWAMSSYKNAGSKVYFKMKKVKTEENESLIPTKTAVPKTMTARNIVKYRPYYG